VSLSHRFIVTSLKTITSLICRIDAAELKQVPQHGPLILYTNHVNILEIPIIFTHLQPRKVRGMLLAERWNIPVLRWMLDVTGTIPLHRGEADINAIRLGLAALSRGEILVISPEGTRSHDGKLQPAHPGVVLLALHSHAALLPVAYYGSEDWMVNLKQLRRTDFHLRVGKPFYLQESGKKITKETRQRMVDEMMGQLAQLLPAQYRGCYGEWPAAKSLYLEFI
jgi:1-acyl-sn-glycerol-3-phosphate acyltransferase